MVGLATKSGYQLTGILITVVGVIITVFAVSTSVSFSVIGYIFLTGAVVAYSLYSVQAEKASEYSSSEMTFVMLAIFLTNVTIAKIGANRNGSFVGISTAISVMSGVLILHEQFSTLQLVGVVVIVAGVYIANSMAKHVD